MKNIFLFTLIAVAFSSLSFMFTNQSQNKILESNLTHRQMVWVYALEWCESRGFKDALNPMDKDGTPSYFSFQFKPETFKAYIVKYGLLSSDLSDSQYFEEMKNYEITKKIVFEMMKDKSVKWENEFPDCVKRHIGYPPLK